MTFGSDAHDPWMRRRAAPDSPGSRGRGIVFAEANYTLGVGALPSPNVTGDDARHGICAGFQECAAAARSASGWVASAGDWPRKASARASAAAGFAASTGAARVCLESFCPALFV